MKEMMIECMPNTMSKNEVTALTSYKQLTLNGKKRLCLRDLLLFDFHLGNTKLSHAPWPDFMHICCEWLT